MSIIRVNHDKDRPYALIAKAPLNDENLSWEAKGLWAYLIARPDNWQVSVSHLAKNFPSGRDKVLKIIKELVLNDLCYWHQERNPNGTTGNAVYTIFEEKDSKLLKDLKEKYPPRPEKPVPVEPVPVEPTLKNTDIKDSSSKEDLKKEKDILARTDSSESIKLPKKISFSFQKMEFENISEQRLQEWKDIYPLIDLDTCFKAMIVWIKDNPEKSLKKTQWAKFISNWLDQQNDKAKVLSKASPRSASTLPESEETKKNKALWEEALEKFPEQCAEINVFRGILTAKDGRDVCFTDPHDRFKEVVKKMLGLQRKGS